MSVLVAILLGTLTGLCMSLVPGLTLAVALGGLYAAGLPKAIGLLEAACFVGAAAGGALYAKHLATLLNPSAASGQLANLDPALRLVQKGRASAALQLMVLATDLAWLPVIFFAGVVAIASLGGVNAIRQLDTAVGMLGIPLILLWMWSVCKHAKHRVPTAIGFLLAGLYGYTALHAPVASGSEYQLSPILAGLFGIPIALAAMRSGTKTPVHLEANADVDVQRALGLFGSIVGCGTGFFAGLGAGSLVSMAQSMTETDEDYVLLATSGEVSNDLMALVLVLAAGMGRSGEAVLLGRVLGESELVAITLVVSAVLFGAYLSRGFVQRFATVYAKIVTHVPKKFWGLFVIGLSLIPVGLAGGPTLTGQLTSWGILLAGVVLARWFLKNHLPNQVAFGALAVPIVLQTAGLVPFLNGALFG